MKARLLLQVEDREPVEVLEFEPDQTGDYWTIPALLRKADSDSLAHGLTGALTVEVREFLADEDPATAGGRVNEDDDRRPVTLCPHGNDRSLCTDEMCYLIEHERGLQ
jgi:hypothetical protein